MKLTFESKEKIAGAFIVIIVVLLLTFVVMIGRAKRWFETYVTYYTVFDEAYNLSEDARVKLFNADIGKVKSVRLEGDKVKVELAILEDYAGRIRRDSVATVESPTFIGSEYVSIKPGTPEAPPVPEYGTIPSKPKRSLTDIMAEFEVEETAWTIIKCIQTISEILEHLRDPEGPLFAALKSTSNSMANIEAVTREIREGKGSLGKLVRSEELLQQIYAQLDHIGGVLQALEGASEQAPEIMAGLRDSVGMINQILVNIEQGSQDIPIVTETTKQGIREIRDSVEQIDRVVRSAQKSFLIRSNLPPEPKGESIDTGLRR